MLALHAIPLALQLAVPLLLLGWFARSRNASIYQWLTKAAVVALYLFAAHVAGVWMLLPWYTAAILMAGLVAIALAQASEVQRLPLEAPRVPWVLTVVGGTTATFALAVIAAGAMARWMPQEQVIDLEFPLRHGVYYVVGGGSVELLNPHLMTLTADRFRPFRGQSYAVDVLKLGAYGLRASGWLPADPARYAIYGDPVHAPCSGLVVQFEDGAPDMQPPQPDRSRMAGNHVLLDCGGVHVLVGHLKTGTIRARPGQFITAGAVIAVVGNSGNSNEPHLHIHAQRPAAPGDGPLSGDPLPIRFGGRYLVRNDRVTAR